VSKSDDTERMLLMGGNSGIEGAAHFALKPPARNRQMCEFVAPIGPGVVAT